MPGMDGIELLRKIKREDPDTEVIMITGHGDMNLAIQSFKEEAADFITKPIDVDALEIALMRAREKIVMRQQLRSYTHHLEALVREKIELQDHLSTLGLMIGSISHSIKGLLTGLDGGMYLLDSGFAKENPEKIEEGWAVVKLMVERIRKLVLDILFCAKKREFSLTRVDVLDFAREIAGVLNTKMISGLAFEQVYAKDLGTLEIDAGYVQAALVNILENAVDACRQDTAKTDHRIVFTVAQDPDHVIFTVADDGIGMDRKVRAKLFTIFFSSKGSEGTGLGLFVADKIIQQHGGRIEVRSIPAQGSTFSITLPKKPPSLD